MCVEKILNRCAGGVDNPNSKVAVTYHSLTEDSGKLEQFLGLFSAISIDSLRCIQEGKVDTRFFCGLVETGDQMSSTKESTKSTIDRDRRGVRDASRRSDSTSHPDEW